eukprot:3500075-Pleurochrysis_carterae.AAC.3
MGDRPVAVGVSDQLISSIAIVLNAFVRSLRNVDQHAICMLVHLLRGEGRARARIPIAKASPGQPQGEA